MKKCRILIELTGRYLTDAEADALRSDVAAMKPKLHLVLSGWRWIEARGVSESNALRLIASLQALGLSFKVVGQSSRRRGACREWPQIELHGLGEVTR